MKLVLQWTQMNKSRDPDRYVGDNNTLIFRLKVCGQNIFIDVYNREDRQLYILILHIPLKNKKSTEYSFNESPLFQHHISGRKFVRIQ